MSTLALEPRRRWGRHATTKQARGDPALKGLLPHVGGEVVGFWLSTDACPEPEVEGSEVESCTNTNVTWVIRWPSKEARDAGWDIVDSSPEYGEAKAKRKEICAAAYFTLNGRLLKPLYSPKAGAFMAFWVETSVFNVKLAVASQTGRRTGRSK